MRKAELEKIVDAFIKDYFTDDDQNTVPYEERMMSLDRNDMIEFAKYVIGKWKKEMNRKGNVKKPFHFPWFC